MLILCSATPGNGRERDQVLGLQRRSRARSGHVHDRDCRSQGEDNQLYSMI